MDDIRLFEFVRRIRVEDKVWMNGFETADDVIDALRIQMAYAMMVGLSLQFDLRGNQNQALLRTLSPRAFRIAVDQPRAWEARLFAEVLHDETESHKNLRRQYDLQLTLGSVRAFDDNSILPWVSERLRSFAVVAEAAGKLVDAPLTEALGPLGHPGNVGDIVFVARQVGEVYRRLIEWTQEVRCAHVEEDFLSAMQTLSEISRDMIEKLGSWGENLRLQMVEAIAEDESRLSSGVPPKKRHFNLTIDVFDPDMITESFREAFRKRGFTVDE